MTDGTVLLPAVAIIGAGPAGLTAAAALAPHVPEVFVLERERQAGGIPRHSDHTGYGLRDLRRSLRGPVYAARLVEQAMAAGANVQTEAMVSRLDGGRTLSVTSPTGVQLVRPRALILATGARERPRAARLIAGDRPAGVYTTGHLQSLVHLQHRSPGQQAVVVGAELVSWSAVLTLRHAGCRTVLMTTAYDRPESYKAFSAVGRTLLRVPVAVCSRVISIEGRNRVEAVQVLDTTTGVVRRIECDTVVLTGDWVPDNELARMAGLDLAAGSAGPAVDATLRTSHPGVFAIGNLVHPVDTADVAALDGRHVLTGVRRWLDQGEAAPAGVRIVVDGPLRWITPSRLRPDDRGFARGRLVSWCEEFVGVPVVEVRQDGRLLGRTRLPWPAVPGRAFRIPARVLDPVSQRGGDVSLSLG